MTSLDGRTLDGEWKDNRYWNGIEYDKNGNITGRCLGGKKKGS
jgi:hypothetical protein